MVLVILLEKSPIKVKNEIIILYPMVLASFKHSRLVSYQIAVSPSVKILMIYHQGYTLFLFNTYCLRLPMNGILNVITEERSK